MGFYVFECHVFWTIVVDWMPYLLLSLLILFNALYSVRWVLRISATIATEKEQRRYDLLASLPSGLLGVSWAISAGCVHRRSSFRWMPYLILLGAISVTCMLTLFTAFTFAVLESTDLSAQGIIGNLSLIQLAIVGIALMVIFYFDHIYSILTAILVGQIASVDLNNAAEAQIRAFIGFLGLQFLLYSISYGVIIFTIPNILTFFGVNGIRVYVGLALFGVVFYLLLREVLVKVLWNLLYRLLLADDKEIALVLEPPYMLEKILKEGEIRVPQMIDNL